MPVQDALLLVLVVVSMGTLIALELPAYWDDLRKFCARWSVGSPPAATAVQAPAVPAMPPRPAPKPVLPLAADLLLVDDSAVARAMLRRLFEASGYTVQLANDGVEALTRLEQGRYAMMITDLEMPNMDGVTLVNRCLADPALRGLPILAVSGHESLRAKFNECRNICGVHRKPWADDILLSHVATLIGVRKARAPALAMH